MKSGTISRKVLNYIKNKGEAGASLTEIQFYVWVETGHDPGAFHEKDRNGQRKTRGHWCDADNMRFEEMTNV